MFIRDIIQLHQMVANVGIGGARDIKLPTDDVGQAVECIEVEGVSYSDGKIESVIGQRDDAVTVCDVLGDGNNDSGNEVEAGKVNKGNACIGCECFGDLRFGNFRTVDEVLNDCHSPG